MGRGRRPHSGKWNRKVKRLREALRDRQGNACAFCGIQMTTSGGSHLGSDVTLEHVRPLSMGGGLNDDDCVAACWDCNQHRNRIMQSIAA